MIMRIVRRTIIYAITFGPPAFLMFACGIIGTRVYRWEAILWGTITLLWMGTALTHYRRANENKAEMEMWQQIAVHHMINSVIQRDRRYEP